MGIYRGAFVVSCRIDPSRCLTCRVSANGYEALPGNELEDEKKASREQEELEDRYEKMLMDVYDTLYKVGSFTSCSPSMTFLNLGTCLMLPDLSLYQI